LIQRVNTD
jgi:hypothetical protein